MSASDGRPDPRCPHRRAASRPAGTTGAAGRTRRRTTGTPAARPGAGPLALNAPSPTRAVTGEQG
ncbi:hypothetical protein HBB16_01975 [Pseudonocardia sp. MCCB 268]|nr:hypothetical protein [Pseudonocardia cytotoxica]